MNLYICSTYYHVYITLIKKMVNNYESDLMVLDYIPNGKTLASSIRNHKLFDNVFFVNNYYDDYMSNHKYLSKIGVFNKHILKKICAKKLKIDFLKYDKIYLFMDDIWIARYFKLSKIHYNIIEDGIDSYKYILTTNFAYTVKKSIKKKIVSFIRNTGYKYNLKCKYVDSIEVNEKKGLQIEDDGRIIEVSRADLVTKLNPEQKQVILSIFLNDRELLSKKNIVIIFTRPFYNDKIIDSISKQLNIYNKLIDIYKKYNVFLKPHPRDQVDYSNIKNVNVIEKNFPSEVINFINTENVIKYVAIESHCVDVYPPEKVDYYELKDFID